MWFEHRVSYGETDAMGYLYYAEYLHIFERSRSALMRRLGMGYARIEARGVMLPVREARCRYRRPARYDDLLRVHVSVSELRGASMTFVYLVQDMQGKPCADGMTQHACASVETGRPVPMPDWLRAFFTG
jgi:acyl-CoA thioester hydrolase